MWNRMNRKLIDIFKKKSVKIVLFIMILLAYLSIKEYVTAKNKSSTDDKIIKDSKFHTVND